MDLFDAVRNVLGLRHDPELLAAATGRLTMSAVMDHSITRDGAPAEMHTLIYGDPLRRPEQGRDIGDAAGPAVAGS